jgi:NAD(P)-dependent dehydrogenase (short-subunit alcohol dehydrogenase family)
MSRVCLITGAGGLLGGAWCVSCADDYDIVAVHHTEPPKVATQHARLFDPIAPRAAVPEAGRPVFAIRADLAVESEVDRVVELALARFGRVDLLVNAAADVAGTAETVDPRRFDAWQRQLVLNALGPVRLAATLAQAFWRGDEPANRARRRNVVNVSSTAGLARVVPAPNRAVYAASKAALNAITRGMAAEYRNFGVRVNAVAPTNFPEVLPTAGVIEAIRRLDAGRTTGRVLVLDGRKPRWS